MQPENNGDIYTSLPNLVRMRHESQNFNYLPRQRVGSLLSGRRHSRLRGRGLDFDELRHYQPGDDIRNMDWRVTNRTGKPHVRVFQEERDRPVIAVVDQRLSMFFGSQKKMKSVVAAEAAAITAWRVLAVGDRIGALLFNDSRTIEIKPTRSERRVVGWLGDLNAMNNDLTANSQQASSSQGLNSALESLERNIGHDHLVVLVTDFYGWNDLTLRAIRRIRQHNDVICTLVFDPLERDISRANNLVVSDGQFQLQIDPGARGLGRRFEASFENSIAHVQAELKRYDIPVLTLDTVSAVGHQLQRQLGGQKNSQ